MTGLPRGWREHPTGALACPHRDVTCCPGCARSRVEVVEVFAQHFWIPDPAERAALVRQIGVKVNPEPCGTHGVACPDGPILRRCHCGAVSGPYNFATWGVVHGLHACLTEQYVGPIE